MCGSVCAVLIIIIKIIKIIIVMIMMMIIIIIMIITIIIIIMTIINQKCFSNLPEVVDKKHHFDTTCAQSSLLLFQQIHAGYFLRDVSGQIALPQS